MSLYTTQLRTLPKWRLKVRTTIYNGKHLAIASFPTNTGVLTINKEGATEHEALHRAIDTLETLVNRIQYPHAGTLN